MKTLFYSICILLIFSSCKKTKLDNEMGHLKQFEPGELSGVRLINTAEYGQVTVNGNQLTNFIGRKAASPLEPYVIPGSTFWSDGYPGTDYFPVNGYLGREWRIPRHLFRENGRLDLFLEDAIGFGGTSRLGITLNGGEKNVDYYLGGYSDGAAPYFVVSRDETAPARPGYFKIRVINLSYPLSSGYGNPRGLFRDLSGPVSLCYADGTPVDQRTSHIGYEKRASEYIELPYGKYQFRILHHSGWQLPATDGDGVTMTLDPPTASTDLNFLAPNYQVYAPVHSYQPGSVYTIMVHPSLFRTMLQLVPLLVNGEHQNAFRVIEDSPPKANPTFCRLQGFNALPGATLKLRLNGRELSRDIAYGKGSDYEILNAGKFDIEAYDNDGKLVASGIHPLEANQNYTAWIYPDKDGKGQISIAANDLSAETFTGNAGQDNAAYGRHRNNFPFSKRFLNLCPDIPYLTFTRNDGQPLGKTGQEGALTNLVPGKPVLQSPYVGENEVDPYEILAYRSAPGLAPGVWADDISPLQSRDFIANRELYTRIGGPLPVHEPGFFTVAVIGRVGANVPAAYKAKMVILKHNK